MLKATGKTEDAVVAQRQAVALAERVTDDFMRLHAVAHCRNNLGEALENAKRPAEAEAAFRQSLADYRNLVDQFPMDVDHRWGVAMTSTNLAEVLLQQNRPADARELIEEAGKIFDGLTKTLGDNVHFRAHQGKQKRVRDEIRLRLDARKP
jgi:hypothetical protein